MSVLLALLPTLLVILGGVVASIAQLPGFDANKWQKKLSLFGIALSLLGGIWTAIDDFRGGSELLRQLSALAEASEETASTLGESLSLTSRNLQLTETSIQDIAQVARKTEGIQERAALTHQLSEDIARIVTTVSQDMTGGDAFPFVFQFGQAGLAGGPGVWLAPPEAQINWSIKGGRVLYDLELELMLPVSQLPNGQWDYRVLASLKESEQWETAAPSFLFTKVTASAERRPLYLLARASARNGYWTQALLITYRRDGWLTWRAEVQGVTFTKEGEQPFQYRTADRQLPTAEKAEPLLPLTRERLDALGVPQRQVTFGSYVDALTHGSLP